MPRLGTNQSGYEVVHVCAYCIEYLNSELLPIR
jgi:hypothetical protein